MMTCLVRRLHKTDLSIAGLVAVSFIAQSAGPTAHLEELLADDRNILIAALRDETPIGFLIAHQFPSLSGERLVYLYDIEVREPHRRAGIARDMVELLKTICADRGVHRIWVGSSLTNPAACALWSATGATRVSDQYAEFIYDFNAASPLNARA